LGCSPLAHLLKAPPLRHLSARSLREIQRQRLSLGRQWQIPRYLRRRLLFLPERRGHLPLRQMPTTGLSHQHRQLRLRPSPWLPIPIRTHQHRLSFRWRRLNRRLALCRWTPRFLLRHPSVSALFGSRRLPTHHCHLLAKRCPHQTRLLEERRKRVKRLS